MSQDGELLVYLREDKTKVKENNKEQANMEGMHDLVEALQRPLGVDNSRHYSQVLGDISTGPNISVLERLPEGMKATAAEKSPRERLKKQMEEQRRCYERDCQ